MATRLLSRPHALQPLMQRFKNALPTFGSSNGQSFVHTEPPISAARSSSLSARRSVIESLLATLTSYHKTASKVRPNPSGGGSDKLVQLPVIWVGEEMVGSSQDLDRLRDADLESREYGRTLRAIGDGYLSLGSAVNGLNDTIAMRVVEELEQLQQSYAAFSKAVKESDKARSALESRLASGKEDGSERRLEIEYGVASETVQNLAESLESTFGTEQRILDDLLDAELNHAEKRLEILRSCKVSLGSGSRTPSRAAPPSNLAVPPRFATRMSRSHSDSVVRRPDIGSSSDHDVSSGARRSTISSNPASRSESPKASRPEALKSRSRSGSMLNKLTPSAFRGKKKKAEKEGAEGDEEESDLEAYRHEESDVPDESDSARTNTGTPSRPNSNSPSSSRRNTGMATLSSLKNLSLVGASNGSSTGYGSLVEESPSSSPAASSPLSPNGTRQRVAPPAIKRTRTAPSPSAFRRDTRYVEARWAFSTTANDELNLEKGDVIRVEREINTDWWRGTIVSVQLAIGASRVGREGMFPSAYVVPSSAMVDDELDFGRVQSRDSQLSVASTATATDESDIEDDRKEEKTGLAGAAAGGGMSGQSTPRRGPPPPLPGRRRTGELQASPFAG